MADLSEQLDGSAYVYLDMKGVKDLGPIAEHPELVSIAFRGKTPALGPLRELPALRNLSFDGPAPDLEPLAGLASLETLSLPKKTGAAQLASLAGLPSLKHLTLAGGFEHLGGASLSLTTLTLSSAKIADLSVCAGLDGLEHLSVGARRSAVSDLGPLAGLTGLTGLSVSPGAVTDLRPLRGLTRLRSLTLDGHKTLVDLTGLEGCIALENLALNLTKVAELAPLSKLPALRLLKLRKTAVTSLTALVKLPLTHLWLEKSKLASLAGVEQLTALEVLWCWGSKVKDLGPLADHPTLEELNIADLRRPQRLEVLGTLTQLRSLDVYQLELDPQILAPLTKLEQLRGCDFPEPPADAPIEAVGAEELGPGTLPTSRARSVRLPSRVVQLAASHDGEACFVALEGKGGGIARVDLGTREVSTLVAERVGRAVAVAGEDLYIVDEPRVGSSHGSLARLPGAQGPREDLVALDEACHDTRLAVSPDGELLAFFGVALRVYRIPSMELVLERPRDEAVYNALAGTFSPQGTLWVQGLEAGVLHELEVPSGEVLRTLPGPAETAIHMMCSARHLVVTGWIARGIYLYDLDDGTRRLDQGWQGLGDSTSAVACAISCDGSLLVRPTYVFECWRLPVAPSEEDAQSAFQGPAPGMMNGADCWAAARTEDALLFAYHHRREGDSRLVWLPLLESGS